MLVIQPSTGKYIIEPAKTYDIELKAIDADDKPIIGKTVNVSTASFPGALDKMQSTTDNNGIAIFKYSAPTSISGYLTFNISFSIEESSGASAVVSFVYNTDDNNESNDTIVDKTNYFIDFEPQDGRYNLPLGMKEKANIRLIDKDNNSTIPDSQVKQITIESSDTSILKLASEAGGIAEKKIVFDNDNDVAFMMIADENNAGYATLNIKIEYVNTNGAENTIEYTYAIAVLTSEPTAFSINDAGIGYNFETKQFEHKYIIQAVDNRGNRISTPGVISAYAMASFAKDDRDIEILYGRFAKDDYNISATLESVSDKGMLTLYGANPFDSSKINYNRAFVAVFGDVETYQANGMWNIESKEADNVLKLSNEYYGKTFEGLGMAIGYNYRDKICTSDYQESVVYVDSTDGKYLLDKDGKTFVTLKFDPYMIGKRVAILVNMTGYDPNTEKLARSGEVHFVTESFSSYLKGDTISVPQGEHNYLVGIWGVIDTGTEDAWSVVNSTFSCDIELNNLKIVGGPYRNDPASCDNDGRAFLNYTVSTIDDTKSGSITFQKCQVDDAGRF